MSLMLTTMINSLNPHTNTPDSDSPISIQWWCGLSYNQQQFIADHYNLPSVSLSPYAILVAYHARHDLRGLPDWPVTTFTKI